MSTEGTSCTLTLSDKKEKEPSLVVFSPLFSSELLYIFEIRTSYQLIVQFYRISSLLEAVEVLKELFSRAHVPFKEKTTISKNTLEIVTEEDKILFLRGLYKDLDDFL